MPDAALAQALRDEAARLRRLAADPRLAGHPAAVAQLAEAAGAVAALAAQYADGAGAAT